MLSHFLEKEFEILTKLHVILQKTLNLFEIVTVEQSDLEKALKSFMNDFEDAVQLSCALKAKADMLITRNLEDFYETNLSIILPSQFFDFI